MINLLLFLFFIACAGLVGAWVAENPGDVTLLWFGWRIDTSVAFLLLALCSLAFILTLALLVLRRLIFAPGDFGERRKLKHYKRGISELTYTVAALAASDVATAETHARKAQKLLGTSPLTVLLSAQIAKSKGEDTRDMLEQLLGYKETRYLASRSLSDAASKNENLPRALELAQQAAKLNPQDHTAAIVVVSLQARMEEWDAAHISINRSKLPRAQKARLRGLLQLAQGEALLEHGNDEAALALAKHALHALPYFAPAAAFAARAYNENHNTRKALRIIKHAWAQAPHPLLQQALSDIANHMPAEKQDKILDTLTGQAAQGAWVCTSCQHTHTAWALHCRSCDSFDTVNWS